MHLIEIIKEKLGICSCQHDYETMFDERYDLKDEEHHTFKIEVCKKCGKIKSIEEL